MNLARKIGKTLRLIKRGDFRLVLSRIHEKRVAAKDRKNYNLWLKKHAVLTDFDRRQIREKIEQFPRRPLISILLPVYNVEEKWLRLAIESVFGQIYSHWELCIADDFSSKPHVRRILEEYTAKDERIKVVFRTKNGHISTASNSALELVCGEFTALLDHDDELAEDALFYVVKEINDYSETAFIYSDEDMIDDKNRRYSPKFKPDFSRDFFYSVNYLTHLAVYRTGILREIGGFRIGFEGSQDYDLALRVVEKIGENQIRHIPRILYHWRAIEGSVALRSEEKPYASERARQAIRKHLERIGKKAAVSQTVYNFHRVSYELPEITPKASLIILADEDIETARQSIKNYVENTDYRDYEIVLVGSEKLRTVLENQSFVPKTKYVGCENRSEAARYNFAAAQTSGEILCFVDSNLRPHSKDWLKELVSFAAQKEIGAVGAKILSAAEKILHGGLIIGTTETVSVANYKTPREADGYLYRARLINNYSAVSISCLAARREVFMENKGFDADNFPDVLFDADFCLRLREKKHRIVFTPYAELTQINANILLNCQKKASEKEAEIFRRKWRNIIGSDPFYNPNLSGENGSFSIKV